MFTKKKNVEVFTHEQNIERARNLHAALLNSGITAHEAPDVIFRLRELYRTIISHDAQHFTPEKMTADPKAYSDSILMVELLNKFRHFSLTREDNDKLQSMHFLAAEHLRNYLVFEDQVIKYARKIHHFLVHHKREIGMKVEMNHGERKMTAPEFYKYGDPPNGVLKVQSLLKNIEKELVPLNLIKIFNKVFDVYANVKPSKSRPPKTAEFYAQQLKKLDALSFASLIAEKKKVKKKVKKVVRKRRKHRTPRVGK